MNIFHLLLLLSFSISCQNSGLSKTDEKTIKEILLQKTIDLPLLQPYFSNANTTKLYLVRNEFIEQHETIELSKFDQPVGILAEDEIPENEHFFKLVEYTKVENAIRIQVLYQKQGIIISTFFTLENDTWQLKSSFIDEV